MTTEEIEGLSHQEALDKLKVIYGNEMLVKSLVSTTLVLDDFAEQFAEITIDVEADKDEKSFERFWVYQKNLLAAVEINGKLRALFDDDINIKKRISEVSARRGTIESRVKKKRDKQAAERQK
jgi:hypothetical protein